jgi:predicted acylesterase/phospholipase RssA
MGEIASLRTPEALNLFRDVVAASASLPVVFPPMLVTAESNGRRFQEMHVDGGVTAPVLTLPEAFLLRDAQLTKAGDLQLYILINNKVEREFQLVPNSTIEIAARSSSTVVKTQTRSILYSTYDFARRNKFGFNLTYIGGRMPAAPSSGFDTTYMRGLFQYGYDRARSGQAWSKSPPSDDPNPTAGYPASARLVVGGR